MSPADAAYVIQLVLLLLFVSTTITMAGYAFKLLRTINITMSALQVDEIHSEVNFWGMLWFVSVVFEISTLIIMVSL